MQQDTATARSGPDLNTAVYRPSLSAGRTTTDQSAAGTTRAPSSVRLRADTQKSTVVSSKENETRKCFTSA